MILVVVAHPDDESFAMGGSIAQLVSDGHDVTVAALADGVGSRFGSMESPRYVAAKKRRAMHFQAALDVLGASGVCSYGIFPDQRSDLVPQMDINIAVQGLVSGHGPSAVYTHHVGDLNLDHRRVAEAVLVATRGVCPVFSIVPEWPSRCVGPAWEPDVTRDIWGEIGRKVSACLAYEDEIRPYPHPRSEQAIRSRQYEQFMVIQ